MLTCAISNDASSNRRPEALEWEKLPAFKKNAVARPVQPAVARSFGDLTLKAPRLLLSSEPEITVREMGADDTLLLLGCDGIWDVLTDQDAVYVTYKLSLRHLLYALVVFEDPDWSATPRSHPVTQPPL